MDKLDLSDEESEDLWVSPSRATIKSSKLNPKSLDSTNVSASLQGESQYDAECSREEALRKELEGIRGINEVIEGVISSLERAKGNMEKVSRTVTSASTLLNTWTRILSQTEHNQRLILNPNWQGATQDIQDMENETALKVQAQERRAAEEERRREEARRKAEDEERQRQAGNSTKGGRGVRGRGRGVGRGTSGAGASSGYVGFGGQGTSTGIGRGVSQAPGRPGLGIRRGIGITRGKGRVIK